ncbi:MAG TPA: DNRLRE domain-containing protein [bacterium]|nr:DNRLRE domain-containing protein [bacterium]
MKSESKRLSDLVLLTVLVLLAGFCARLRAQSQIILQQGMQGYVGCEDAHILIDKPTHNTGAIEGLELTGNGGAGDAKHGLIRFDLSHLSPTLKVDSAWLSIALQFRRTEQKAAKTIGAYELLRSWNAGSGASPEGYDGRQAVAGECNWQFARYPADAWAVAGAGGLASDYAAEAQDSVTIDPGMSNGVWISFDATASVKKWLTEPESNCGWLLRETLISPANGILNFYASENRNAVMRPVLSIAAGADDALFVGSLQVVAGAESLLVRLPASGDSNGNASAEAAIARTGQPQFGTPVAMQRRGDGFCHVFSDLVPATYFVRIRAADPDGVFGSSVQTSSAAAVSADWLQAGALAAERLSGGRLRAILPFEHDLNRNSSVFISCRPAGGDWSMPMAMNRKNEHYEYTYSSIPSGEIRAQINDPNGVVGQAEQTLAITSSPDSGEVAVLFADRRSFLLQSGSFAIRYDADSTDGWIQIRPVYGGERALRTQMLTGWTDRLLLPQHIDSIAVHTGEDSIEVVFHTRTVFTPSLTLYRRFPGLIRCRCAVGKANGQKLAAGGPELQFFDLTSQKSLPTPDEIYARSAPYANSLFYLHDDQVIEGTLFYFVNLTTLNSYFAGQQLAAKNCIAIESTNLGFYRPTGNRALTDQSLVLDSFLFLSPGRRETQAEIADGFLNSLAAIYSLIPHPEEMDIDWQPLAQKMLADLLDPRCRAQVNGQSLLRSYVDVPRLDCAEAITQLDLLVALSRYENAVGETDPANDDPLRILQLFFNTALQTLVNDAPNEGVSSGDSWYAVHVHLGVAALAKLGHKSVQELLFKSLPELMNFAQAVDYRFPVFFNYGTHQAISGREPDATGGYIYLMLDAYDLSGDQGYLDEAIKAAAALETIDFEYTYEVHMTAATCAALLRLYHHTKENHYIEASLMPLANLLRLVWWWECDYGYAKDYRTFMGLLPMAEAEVITPMEQHHSFTYLQEYLQLGRGLLPHAAVDLTEAFLHHTPQVIYYTLPGHLPAGAVIAGPTIYESYNDRSLAIPLEDLRDGWQKSGWLGQQIYGSGAPLVFAAAQATQVEIHPASQPQKWRLSSYPNPFNGSTTFDFYLPKASISVSLAIVNLLGQRVAVLVQGPQSEGNHRVVWQPDEKISSGVYWAVLDGEETATAKVLYMR